MGPLGDEYRGHLSKTYLLEAMQRDCWGRTHGKKLAEAVSLIWWSMQCAHRKGSEKLQGKLECGRLPWVCFCRCWDETAMHVRLSQEQNATFYKWTFEQLRLERHLRPDDIKLLASRLAKTGGATVHVLAGVVC